MNPIQLNEWHVAVITGVTTVSVLVALLYGLFKRDPEDE